MICVKCKCSTDKKRGSQIMCRLCWNKKMNDYYRINKEKICLKKMESYRKNPNISRNANLKNKYGITLSEYNDIFLIQNGKCAICLRHQTEFSRSFHVDHDHITRRVRGLLCHFCNLMLGGAQDKIFALEKAIQYLMRLS